MTIPDCRTLACERGAGLRPVMEVAGQPSLVRMQPVRPLSALPGAREPKKETGNEKSRGYLSIAPALVALRLCGGGS